MHAKLQELQGWVKSPLFRQTLALTLGFRSRSKTENADTHRIHQGALFLWDMLVSSRTYSDVFGLNDVSL